MKKTVLFYLTTVFLSTLSFGREIKHPDPSFCQEMLQEGVYAERVEKNCNMDDLTSKKFNYTWKQAGCMHFFFG